MLLRSWERHKIGEKERDNSKLHVKSTTHYAVTVKCTSKKRVHHTSNLKAVRFEKKKWKNESEPRGRKKKNSVNFLKGNSTKNLREIRPFETWKLNIQTIENLKMWTLTLERLKIWTDLQEGEYTSYKDNNTEHSPDVDVINLFLQSITTFFFKRRKYQSS